MLRRRRRPQREIAFSFDSFLDVVANVVGIILRLILVAWVGARAYHGVPPTPPPTAIVEDHEEPLVTPTTPEPMDPVSAEIERKRRELAETEAALLLHLREQEQTSKESVKVAGDLQDLTRRQQTLIDKQREIAQSATDHVQKAKAVSLSMEKLTERSRQLSLEIEALRKLPVQKKVLRYRTPVSQPVSQELICECFRGRVTVIDRARLEEDATRDVRARIEELRNSFEIRGVTAPSGAFRLRYVVERSKEVLEGTGPGATPLSVRNFSARMTQGMFEPVLAERGDSIDVALQEGSAFRRIIDSLDPQQTAVTLCVYPDSFALYRKLRDYLHDHDIVVAGRPVPEGVTIGISVYGSQSRGQ